MAGRLRVAYNEVLSAANLLAQEGQDIHNLQVHLKNDTDQLHQAGLRGVTSDSWYKDMEEVLLPKTEQLSQILQHASQVMRGLNSLFQNAEQESGSFFKRA